MRFTFNDPDQLSLFDTVSEKNDSIIAAEAPISPVAVTKTPAATVPAPAKPAKNAPKKPVMPAVLKTFQGTVPMADFMMAAKLGSVGFDERHSCDCRYTSNGKTIMHSIGKSHSYDLFVHHWGSTERTLLHLASDGTCWMSNATFTSRYETDESKLLQVKISKWRSCERLSDETPLFVFQDEPVGEILKRTNPYLADFAKEKNAFCSITILLQAPQLETLYKAGYDFAKYIVDGGNLNPSEVEMFNRLCKPGKNPKEIFKTSKAVYSVLKNCHDLAIWDVFRKMDKFGRIRPDSIRQAYDNGYGQKELEKASSVLAKTYNGKPVFSWESLVNYLNRIDQYEAIPALEGLQLLDDYLSMCSQLEMEPKIDGDSLKREHDIAARLVREHRDEMRAKAMRDAARFTEPYNYEEEVFTVRGIRDYDDLIDEAKQQHNCVASYADKISKGQSLVFVMREKSTPDRSLVTIELSPKLEMRQKFLAYNRPIHNKAQSEFIERWLKHCRSAA